MTLNQDPAWVPVEFNLAELYYLHGCIRHDMTRPEEWKTPPVSRRLNEQIATALVRMHGEDGVPRPSETAFLCLSWHDTFVIDYWARLEDRTGGEMVGRNVLLKAFRARQRLDIQAATGLPMTTDKANDLTYREVKRDAQPE